MGGHEGGVATNPLGGRAGRPGRQLDLTGTVAMAYTPPDPARDLRVAEVDGRLAGCAVVQLVGSETVLASDGTEAFCRGHVLPEHRGRGVGSALLGWTLARAAAHPGAVDAWTIAHDADAVPCWRRPASGW